MVANSNYNILYNADTNQYVYNKAITFKAEEPNPSSNQIQSDTFEKHNKSTSAKVGIAAGAAVILTALGDLIFAKGKHIKNLFSHFKAKDINTSAKENVLSHETSSAASCLAGKTHDLESLSISELVKLKNTTAKNTIEYKDILHQIFQKSSGTDKIKVGEEYIKYLDSVINGEVKFDPTKGIRESMMADSSFNWAKIRLSKSRIYAKMSHTYKADKNYDKALEMMNLAHSNMPGNKSIIAEIAKIHALKGTPQDGIKVASEALEKIKDTPFDDYHAYLFDGIAECVKAKGNETLYKAINLLKQESYHTGSLKPEDIKFLEDNKVPVEIICPGGREQTGAMAKWVLEQVAKL